MNLESIVSHTRELLKDYSKNHDEIHEFEDQANKLLNLTQFKLNISQLLDYDGNPVDNTYWRLAYKPNVRNARFEAKRLHDTGIPLEVNRDWGIYKAFPVGKNRWKLVSYNYGIEQVWNENSTTWNAIVWLEKMGRC